VLYEVVDLATIARIHGADIATLPNQRRGR